LKQSEQFFEQKEGKLIPQLMVFSCLRFFFFDFQQLLNKILSSFLILLMLQLCWIRSVFLAFYWIQFHSQLYLRRKQSEMSVRLVGILEKLLQITFQTQKASNNI